MSTSVKYASIPEYIAAQQAEVRANLEELNNCISKTLPQAQACISYNMPCFKQDGMICYFAVFKRHYSLFFKPVHVKHFAKELSGFVQGKSAIQVPIGQKFPESLLKSMLQHAAESNRLKAESKKQKSRK